MLIENVSEIYSNDGVQLINFGISHLANEDSENELGHSHPNLELNYIKSGKGKYYIDNRIYDIIPGDIFIINNIEFHRIEIETSELIIEVVHFNPHLIWSVENRNFDLNYLKPFFDRPNSFENRLDRNNPMRNEMKKLFEDIEFEMKNKLIGHELYIKNRILEILAHYTRHYMSAEQYNNIKSFTGRDMDAMVRASAYIENAIPNDINIEELASIFHMSTSYFSTLFKKTNGISPIKYILQKRVARAIDLLQSTDKSIAEIADLCGFNSLANFYKAFKKVTGQIPTYYRSESFESFNRNE